MSSGVDGVDNINNYKYEFKIKKDCVGNLGVGGTRVLEGNVLFIQRSRGSEFGSGDRDGADFISFVLGYLSILTKSFGYWPQKTTLHNCHSDNDSYSFLFFPDLKLRRNKTYKVRILLFYGVVERHFINSYFGMLLVNGLTADLPRIIRDSPVFAEEENDTGTWVFHIGSVKLILNDNVDIAVHVHTAEGQRCGLMVYIWQTYADAILTAEFQLVGDLGRTTTFTVPLPETLGHPLCAILAQLKLVFTFGNPNTVGARLKTWAAKQK